MRHDILIILAEHFRKMEQPPAVDLNPDTLGDVTLQQLDLDSLKSLALLMHLEEKLGVESPVEQHPDDTTLNALAGHYEALVQGQS